MANDAAGGTFAGGGKHCVGGIVKMVDEILRPVLEFEMAGDEFATR
jgi:hypothetical protein